MKTVFKGKKITGVLGLIPKEVCFFDDEVDNYAFPQKQTLRLKKVMGFEKHRVARDSSTASDFCISGIKYLLDSQKIKKEEIGAIVVVTLSPDYFVPQISNIIHGECGLSSDVLCMDISQGCCGYLMGLMQSFLLLDVLADKKVVLFNTDVLSQKVSKHDRNDYPLVGDATGITIVENDENAKDIYFNLLTDGENRNALCIPAGGFAMPCSGKTSVLQQLEDGNARALEHLHMDGAEVFNFVQRCVPTLIDETLKDIGANVDDMDYYLFHQPNKFMLKKLADKIGIPYEKMFMNIVENLGNPSGASIPINICFNLGNKLLEEEYKCCLSAFGSGLSWGSMVMYLGKLDFCEMKEIDY